MIYLIFENFLILEMFLKKFLDSLHEFKTRFDLQGQKLHRCQEKKLAVFIYRFWVNYKGEFMDRALKWILGLILFGLFGAALIAAGNLIWMGVGALSVEEPLSGEVTAKGGVGTATPAKTPAKRTIKTVLAKVSYKPEELEGMKSLNACDEFGKAVLSSPLEEVAGQIALGSLSVPPDCFVKHNRADVIENCKSEEPFICLNHLGIYRIKLMGLRVEGKETRGLTDEEILAKFFSSFINGKFNEETKEALVELKKRYGDSPALSKAEVVTELAMSAPKVGPTKAITGISDLLDHAIKLNPEDSDLLELEMMRAFEDQDRDQFIKDLGRFNRENMGSGLGHYMLARVSWRGENRALTIEELEKAMTREPEVERYKKTYELAKTSEFGERIFTYHMQSNISLLDL